MLAAARTVVTFGILFQAAGFGKLLVIASYFGAGPQLDGYYLGLVVPTFLVGLSSALLQTGFVPAYVEATSRNDLMGSEELRSAALTWTMIALGIAAAFFTVTKRPALALLWPNIDPEIHKALDLSFGLLVWTAPLNGLADGIGLLLNAEGRFWAAASAPVINLVVSTTVLVLWPTRDMDALIWSMFLGLASQIAVVTISLRWMGLKLAPRLVLRLDFQRTMLAIGIPVLLASVLANSVPAFMQVMAARSGPGAVSALAYVNRLQKPVIQAIVTSVSVVLLPHYARLLAEGRESALRSSLSRTLAATSVFYFATIAFILVGGRDTVALLLQRGRFTAADTQLVSDVWLALSVGLLGATWGIFLARLFQAKQEPWFIAKLSIVSLGINVVLCVILVPLIGVIGVALANSVAYTVVMVLFHVFVLRLANALSALYPQGSDEKRLLDAMLLAVPR